MKTKNNIIQFPSKTPQRWFIFCHERKMWWRANECGYTENIEEAGIYSFDHARMLIREANSYIDNVPEETMVCLDDLRK